MDSRNTAKGKQRLSRGGTNSLKTTGRYEGVQTWNCDKLFLKIFGSTADPGIGELTWKHRLSCFWPVKRFSGLAKKTERKDTP